jgi:wobble nucleotide-excising tRNase
LSMKALTKHQLAKQTPRTLAEKVINRENRITYLNNRINELEKELAEAGGMIGVLREYVSDLEKGLKSSITMNKALVEREK